MGLREDRVISLLAGECWAGGVIMLLPSAAD